MPAREELFLAEQPENIKAFTSSVPHYCTPGVL